MPFYPSEIGSAGCAADVDRLLGAHATRSPMIFNVGAPLQMRRNRGDLSEVVMHGVPSVIDESRARPTGQWTPLVLPRR